MSSAAPTPWRIMRHRFHTSTRLYCLCSEPHNVLCNGFPRSSAPFGSAAASRARRSGVRRNGKRGGRVEGPQHASLPLAARHIEGEDHGDRAAQTTALDGGPDRPPTRPERSHPRTRAAATGPESRRRPGTAAAAESLRTPGCGRPAAPGY
jgi:hypothetical protein